MQVNKDVWESQKENIRQLWLVKKFTHKSILEKLASFGIVATKAQLEYQLKKWDFRRNLSADAWRYVDHKKAKRKRTGKESRVILSGIELCPQTVQKETNRNRLPKYLQPPSPRTPPGIPLEICSPIAPYLELNSTPKLPWLDFQINLDYIMSLMVPQNTVAPGSRLDSINLPEIANVISQYSSVSANTIKHVFQIIPESEHGENGRRINALIHGDRRNQLEETVKLFLFRLSNNFVEVKNEEDWEQLKSFFGRGITARPLPPDLTSSGDATMSALLEKIFQTAIRWAEQGDADDLRLIKWVLESGQNPNQTFRDRWDGMTTPLNLSIDIEDLDLAALLIGCGANVNGKMGDTGRTPLAIACAISELEVATEFVKMLVSEGAQVTNPNSYELLYAVKDGNTAVIKKLLEIGANLRSQIKENSRLEFERTPLSEAAAFSQREGEMTALELVQIFFSKTVPMDWNLITPDVLIGAASSGNDAVIEFFWEKGISLDDFNEKDISPLSAAAYTGNLTTCELLLELGVQVEPPNRRTPSALHLAAFEGSLDVVNLLLRHGAIADTVLETSGKSAYSGYNELFRCTQRNINDGQHKTPLSSALNSYVSPRSARADCAIRLLQTGIVPENSQFFRILRLGDVRLVEAALDAGANPNWEESTGLSALQVAFNNYRNHVVANLLLDRGFRPRGCELTQAFAIGDWTLCNKLLQLDAPIDKKTPHGQTLLEAAISSRNEDLIKPVFVFHPPFPYDGGALCAAVVYAIDRADDTWVQKLIARRPSDEPSGSLECTAVAIAAQHGNRSLVQFLITSLTPTSYCRAPVYDIYPTFDFHLHHWFGDLVRSLEYDMCPFWHDYRSITTTPLVFAISRGQGDMPPDSSHREDILSDLVTAGYKLDSFVLSYSIVNAPDLAETMLSLTAVANSSYVETIPGPAYWAVSQSQLSILRALRSRGDNIITDTLLPNDMFDRTIFQLAVGKGNNEIIEFLLDAGADVNESPFYSRGATALQLAAIKGNIYIATRLIDSGAKIDAPGAREYGRTALEGAAENGRLDMLQFLLNHGAEISGDGTRQYVRAVRLAFEECHHTIVAMLKKIGKWPEEKVIEPWTDSDEGIFDEESSDEESSDDESSDEDGTDEEENESAHERDYGSSEEGDDEGFGNNTERLDEQISVVEPEMYSCNDEEGLQWGNDAPLIQEGGGLWDDMMTF